VFLKGQNESRICSVVKGTRREKVVAAKGDARSEVEARSKVEHGHVVEYHSKKSYAHLREPHAEPHRDRRDCQGYSSQAVWQHQFSSSACGWRQGVHAVDGHGVHAIDGHDKLAISFEEGASASYILCSFCAFACFLEEVLRASFGRPFLHARKARAESRSMSAVHASQGVRRRSVGARQEASVKGRSKLASKRVAGRRHEQKASVKIMMMESALEPSL